MCAGRTGRAGTRGRATSFFTDRDAFLVSQIKTALAELEKGNVAAFAMGKEARQAEKALAQQFKSNMKLSSEGLVASGSGMAPAVKVDGSMRTWQRLLVPVLVLGVRMRPGMIECVAFDVVQAGR